jgi:hypothetical protein
MTEGSVLASPAVVRYGTIRALAAVTINSHAPDMPCEFLLSATLE